MTTRNNRIVQAAIVVFITLALVLPASATSTPHTKKSAQGQTVYLNPQQNIQPSGRNVIFQDGFENYADFVIQFPPWTNVDVDGGATYGMNDAQGNAFQWPNNYTAQAYIVFNPYTTVPPMNDDTSILAHSGNKFAACFADVPSSAPDGNNDWLITPQIHLVSSGVVTFWAKSYTLNYGPEQFHVEVSTKDTNPDSFNPISGITPLEAPLNWTQYTFDLSAFDGQDIYIGINDISYDTFIFMVDDFEVTGVGHVADTTPPVTTCVLDGTLVGGVYTSDVTVTLNAVDTLSGVNYTMYMVDDGPWTTYTAPFVVSENGAHTITYYSVDNAANREDNETTTFTIQHAATVSIKIKGGFGVSATITNTGSSTVTSLPVTITVTGAHVFVGGSKSKTIDTLSAGGSSTVKDFVIGIGSVTISVNAGGATASATGKALLFFVLGVM